MFKHWLILASKMCNLNYSENAYFQYQLLDFYSIGEYWNISGVPVYLRCLESASVIRKLTMLEHKTV